MIKTIEPVSGYTQNNTITHWNRDFTVIAKEHNYIHFTLAYTAGDIFVNTIM